MKRGLFFAIVLPVTLAVIGCTWLSDLVSEDPDDLLVLEVNPTNIPADGSSVSTLTARISAGTPDEERVVTFSASAGSFVDGNIVSNFPIEVEADSHGVAVAQLRSASTPGIAIVRAKAGSTVSRGKVRFGVAAPERIDVTTSLFVLHVSSFDTATITATLRRSSGVATSGTTVSFTAEDAAGMPIGGFANVTASDPNGQAFAEFDPGVTAYRGDVTIRASVQPAGGGAPVEGATAVQIDD